MAALPHVARRRRIVEPNPPDRSVSLIEAPIPRCSPRLPGRTRPRSGREPHRAARLPTLVLDPPPRGAPRHANQRDANQRLTTRRLANLRGRANVLDAFRASVRRWRDARLQAAGLVVDVCVVEVGGAVRLVFDGTVGIALRLVRALTKAVGHA